MVEESGSPTTGADGGRRTALYGRHLTAGAKLADFGGWDMPIEYPDGGVLAEHQAVRESVGVFDVSHLGKLELRGPGAAAFLNSCLTNDLGRIVPGKAQYTLCCTDDGGVVDDLIVYLRADDDVLLVPNAANCAEVARRLAATAPAGLTLTDRHDDLAVLAVQGPRAAEVAAAVGLPEVGEYMAFRTATWQGGEVTVCRTGYTGERGVEVLGDSAVAGPLWDALVEAASAVGGRPCGLGARDTLRTEMGYPLHGHELSLEITPVQAGAGWAVGWRKPEFWGRQALLAERERGPARSARALLATDRGVPRAGQDVLAADGRVLGRTTSGTFSPTLRQGIALALLDPAVQPGDEVAVDVRGRRLGCRVVPLPFVPSHVRD
jgi:aminomethyltransferase